MGSADLFADYDASLSLDDMRQLVGMLEASLGGGGSGLPEQEVLRLWWGTATASSEPISAAVGGLYGHLLDAQEGVVSDELAAEGMRRRLVALRRAISDEG